MDDERYELSSRFTLIYKILPLTLFIIIIIFSLRDLPDHISAPLILKLIFFLVFLGAFGYVAVRVALPLKRARIIGSRLIVSNFITDIELPLRNIVLVDGPDVTSGRRITIHLDHKSRFGDKIVIVPGVLRATNVANYLRETVDQLR